MPAKRVRGKFSSTVGINGSIRLRPIELAHKAWFWNFASVNKPCLVSSSTMRPLRLLVLICLALWQCLAVYGEEFRLNNGDVLRGEAVSFNDDGLVVRLDIGGHSPRISWSKLTQETL